ncbi:hypothetical protein M0R72_00665 [Candidatus Pacearchaeota archaeon]|jgi:hypothetical protein|nr:hypothetical protein [Candidatus Pacearchaeota archaeon]
MVPQQTTAETIRAEMPELGANMAQALAILAKVSVAVQLQKSKSLGDPRI